MKGENTDLVTNQGYFEITKEKKNNQFTIMKQNSKLNSAKYYFIDKRLLSCERLYV